MLHFLFGSFSLPFPSGGVSTVNENYIKNHLCSLNKKINTLSALEAVLPIQIVTRTCLQASLQIVFANILYTLRVKALQGKNNNYVKTTHRICFFLQIRRKSSAFSANSLPIIGNSVGNYFFSFKLYTLLSEICSTSAVLAATEGHCRCT